MQQLQFSASRLTDIDAFQWSIYTDKSTLVGFAEDRGDGGSRLAMEMTVVVVCLALGVPPAVVQNTMIPRASNFMPDSHERDEKNFTVNT